MTCIYVRNRVDRRWDTSLRVPSHVTKTELPTTAKYQAVETRQVVADVYDHFSIVNPGTVS